MHTANPQAFTNFKEAGQPLGKIAEIRKQLALVTGLEAASNMDLVIMSHGQRGYIAELTPDYAIVVMLDYPLPEVGDEVVDTLLPLGITISPDKTYPTTDMFVDLDLEFMTSDTPIIPIDQQPRGIHQRTKITQPLHTYITAIDMLIPIGKGQRELIIGDRSTGKSTTALQIAESVALQGYKTIVCLIGKRSHEITKIAKSLAQHPQAQKNLTLMACAAHEPVGRIIMTPLAAMTLAEQFADQGHDVVVVFDELTTQANFYRELALIRGSFPGKESFPGDIFHFQAKLLERSGNFIDTEGNHSSITALPVVTATGASLSGYIQTNLMSITDGHLYFDPDLFYDSVRPAINQFLSVTRIGRQTQTPITQSLAGIARKILHDYSKALDFSKFGSQLAQTTQQNLTAGKQLLAILTQNKNLLIPFDLQLYLVGMVAFQPTKPLDIDSLAHHYYHNEAFTTQVNMLSMFDTLPEFRHHLSTISV